MTETSPLASVAWPKERMRGWDEERGHRRRPRTHAGLPLPGFVVRIRDEDGGAVPFDGRDDGTARKCGDRGSPTLPARPRSRGSFTRDGWFVTGDVAIGSPDGYFVIADRTKDLIKSGGEWISSVDMEAAIMAMPEVTEAAVVAVPDPRVGRTPAGLRRAAAGGAGRTRRQSAAISRSADSPAGSCLTGSS